MLNIEGLTIRFPSVTAVKNFSFKFKPGYIYGMIGPNGAGKSSLIRALVGLISAYDGRIEYDKMPLSTHRQKIKSVFGYAPEDTTLLPYLSGREYLQMLADIRKTGNAAGAIEELITLLNMDEIADKIVEGYSHGMGKKLALAAALLGDPKVIIFDEALNGLDPVTMFNVRKRLRRLADAGHLILLSSHVLEVVERWCDAVLIMHQGILMAHHDMAELEKLLAKKEIEFSAYFMQLINAAD